MVCGVSGGLREQFPATMSNFLLARAVFGKWVVSPAARLEDKKMECFGILGTFGR